MFMSVFTAQDIHFSDTLRLSSVSATECNFLTWPDFAELNPIRSSLQECLAWFEALNCVSTSVTDSTALTVMEILLCCRIHQERWGTPCCGLCIKINSAAETLSQPGIKTNFLPKYLTIVKSNNNLSDWEQRRWITWMDYICPAWIHNQLYYALMVLLFKQARKAK